MKIDRRCFLTLGAGLVVGTTFSPLPWKLTDDISIWTQNWPWTPVPEEGPKYVKQSVCTMCGGGCGINVIRIKDRVIKIEGNKDYPVNRGSLCPLGLSGAQYLYGPSRIKSPMKRVGEKGSGQFEPISWDKAMSEVSGKLSELRKQGKAHTVASISESDRGTVPYLIERFMSAYGSPNFIRTPSFFDSHELAIYLTQGQQGQIGFDLENAGFILSFGAALLDGWGPSGRVFNVYGNLDKNKQQIVQIDSRLSDTASKATKWLAAKPGTEGALALGLAHIIIRDQLYNKDFVDNFGHGFEDFTDDSGKSRMGFKTLVKQYTPSKTAEITSLDKSRIEWLARAFARSSRPVAVSGYGQGAATGGVDQALAVHALNALVGNINKPGGMTVIPAPEYMDWSEMQVDKAASEGRQQPRADMAGSDKYPDTRYLANQLPGVINSAKGESPIQALLVADGNPVYTMEDTEATKKAFAKIPFIASFSSYMDETTRFADIILPNHMYLERYQDVPTPEGLGQQIIGLSQPVVTPKYDTRHIGDTFIEMAKSMGGSIKSAFPWKDYETFLEETLKDKWDELKDKGYWTDKKKPASWQEAFQTPSGKYEFYPTARKNVAGKDQDVLPDFRSVELPGDEKKFPLMILPYNTIRLSSGAMAASPFMIKTIDSDLLHEKISFAQINPKTAKQYSLPDGALATIRTPKGEARVRVYHFDGVMPGLVAMPRGLGHTAFNQYIADKGVNVNELLDTVADPSSGLNMAWGIRASLQKA